MGYSKERVQKAVDARWRESTERRRNRRFWKRVVLPLNFDNEKCWGWRGSFFQNGYPQLWHNNTNMKGNRLSWEINRGPIPEGMMVLHTCDNKGCVNPSHLYLGTHTENMKDASKRGRHKSGEDHYHFIRTEGVVDRCKDLRRCYSADEVAEYLGIGRTTVYRCLNAC